jgi:hypothetical protein
VVEARKGKWYLVGYELDLPLIQGLPNEIF